MADNPDAMAELRTMLASREARYAQAHMIVDTARRTPQAIAEAIVTELASRE
jgi:shikimate kinase